MVIIMVTMQRDKHGDHHGDHAEDKHGDHHGDHDDHDHGAFDPHAWQNVANAVIYVNNITAALSQIPANFHL